MNPDPWRFTDYMPVRHEGTTTLCKNFEWPGRPIQCASATSKMNESDAGAFDLKSVGSLSIALAHDRFD
jgi:hypothetical protein